MTKIKISPTLGLKRQSHLNLIIKGFPPLLKFHSYLLINKVQICNPSANLNLRLGEVKVRFDYGLL